MYLVPQAATDGKREFGHKSGISKCDSCSSKKNSFFVVFTTRISRHETIVFCLLNFFGRFRQVNNFETIRTLRWHCHPHGQSVSVVRAEQAVILGANQRRNTGSMDKIRRNNVQQSCLSPSIRMPGGRHWAQTSVL
jgi:hypothetical protein